jgi:hypothetical protein
MKLDTRQADVVQYPCCTLNWWKETDLNPCQLDYQASTWVHLLELPNPFSHDEALLLCQHSENEWIAWIPDHGEALLNVRQFCPAY